MAVTSSTTTAAEFTTMFETVAACSKSREYDARLLLALLLLALLVRLVVIAFIFLL